MNILKRKQNNQKVINTILEMELQKPMNLSRLMGAPQTMKC